MMHPLAALLLAFAFYIAFNITYKQLLRIIPVLFKKFVQFLENV